MAKYKIISHHRKVSSRIDRNIEDILVVGADLTKSRTAELTPVGPTGDLKGSWATSDVKRKTNSSEIKVGSGLPYAPRVELGFVGEDILGRTYNQQGRYMLTNAFNETKKFIKNLFKTKLLR